MLMTEDYLIEKILTRNDVGETGSHQAGITIPKSLIPYFPRLDPNQNNPDTYIEVEAPNETKHLWRYIYYNNKLHSSTGTRNEFRITRLASFLRQFPCVRSGDILRIQFTAGNPDSNQSTGEIIPGNPPPSSKSDRRQYMANTARPVKPARRGIEQVSNLTPSRKPLSPSKSRPNPLGTEQGEFIIRTGNWRVARART